MKKAFTLIELLAVIIILAIVALIATPIILDVIEDARISAGKSEANMILGGINNYCASEDMKYQLDNSYKRICTTSMNADNVKDMVNLGNAEIKEIAYDGKKLTTLVIESNNHKFTLCPSGTFAMDNEECDGEIVVKEESLIDLLLKQYVEGKEVGLIKDATNENLYYYTGTNEEVSNNYLWYGGHQWRILEIDNNLKTLTLITQQPLTIINPASAVWETQSAYESSYINTWLNVYFWNSLDNTIQSKVLDSTFNIGIYSDVDEITTTKKIGLLDESQYVRAGGTKSYLNISNNFWLGNRYTWSNIPFVRYVRSDGALNDNNVSGNYGVRAVMKVSNLTIVGGEGSSTNNYYTANKSTNTSNVQVGEYINVPYSGNDKVCDNNKCTFRVISKDIDSIKITLNGLLSTESQYGNSSTITLSHTIYTPLNEFANNISNNYRYTENKTFYIGVYPSTNYNDVNTKTLSTNIGLPTVGEMFSGNDINLSSSRGYWTMNSFNTSYTNVVFGSGTMNMASISDNYGVRPVMYLKNNLNFIGGNGTVESPYELQ